MSDLRIRIRGCDDETNIDASHFTEAELEAIRKLAALSQEASEYRCQPDIHFDRVRIEPKVTWEEEEV